MPDTFSRKSFMIITGAVAATAVPPAAAEACERDDHEKPSTVAATTTHKPSPAPVKPLGTQPEAYVFFTAPEALFIEAAVERLIPADSHGPGAKEARVPYFIDQQLAGAYGLAAKMYMSGPWGEALPTQGYQYRATPQEVYRVSIAATNAYTQQQYKKDFADLDVAHQDQVLHALDGGSVTFDQIPATVFFNMLLADTVEGFFADPMYGGNYNKTGWRQIGFPGVAAAYLGTIEQHNKPYKVEPMSVADEMQGTLAMHGDEPVEHLPVVVAARRQAKGA